MFSKSANLLDLLQKSTIHSLFKAKSIDPKTYSPSWYNVAHLGLISHKLYQSCYTVLVTGSKINYFRQVPAVLETNFFFSVDLQMEKCGCQNLSIKFFLYSTTQKCEVFQDVSSSKNIPTPEQSQESDSRCKSCSLQ